MYRNSKIKICGKQLCKINGKVDQSIPLLFIKNYATRLTKKG
jgi:hypothetical protein